MSAISTPMPASSAPPLAIHLAAFPSLTDTRPRPLTLPWTEVVKRLSVHEERQTKDGPGWSPAVYRAGATRGIEGVEAVTALSFDVDDEPAWELLQGYEYVAHTTFSHTPETPRWRIVLPLTRPVPAEQWAHVWERARLRLCPNADEACRDASRFFWKPACKPGAERHAFHQRGAILDPDRLPALPVPPAPREHHATPQGTGRPGDDFNERASWEQILEPAGWKRIYERGDESYWRRPGKRDGISATVNYKGSGLLYVFSNNADPFHPNTSHTKFGAYAALHHGGDHSAAAKTLAAEGYGDQSLPVDLGRGRSAKSVTSKADTLSGGRQNGRSYLGNASPDAKALTKSVTPQADTLSTGEGRKAPLTWDQLGCRLGSEVQPENVDWLWDQRIALGKLNIVEGNGGEGKSLVLDDLAARLTANLPMPDDTPNPFGEPVKVVLLMAEDDAADTIIPRIMAAGGNPANVVLLDHVPDADGGHFPTIPDDLDHIEHVVRHAQARALIIDPLASYLSEEVNSHNDHSVRRALATLPAIASRHDCAIVVVRHLNKNTSADPKHRGSGAGAFINLARLGLAIGPDPDDDSGERRILAVNKVNVGEQAGALAYHIETAWVRRGDADDTLIKTAKVVWDGPSTLTSADILGARPDEETRTASEIAKDMLLQLLGGTPQDEETVWAAVKQAQVSRSSYMRARRALGVVASRVGGVGSTGKWQLSLPEKATRAKSVTPRVENRENEVDTLSKTAPPPDRDAPAAPPKSVNQTSDTLSAPGVSGCARCGGRAVALDRGVALCFGCHPLGTNAPLMPHLTQARERGA